MQNNYKSYRENLSATETPAVPYIGVFLKDLTFICDGNPDYLRGGLINLHKRRQVQHELLTSMHCIHATPCTCMYNNVLLKKAMIDNLHVSWLDLYTSYTFYAFCACHTFYACHIHSVHVRIATGVCVSCAMTTRYSSHVLG